MQPESIHPDDLIGATKHNSKWRLFAGTVAEWILDYASYDPVRDPAYDDEEFRANLLVVDRDNAELFLKAMEPYELMPKELGRFLRKAGRENWPLSVLVDFDDKLCVNAFADIPIHAYIPPGWKGVEGSPLDYVPDTIRRTWRIAPRPQSG